MYNKNVYNMNMEPVTVENLKTLCESDLYQSMLNEFAERSNRVIANLKDDWTAFRSRLVYCQRRYHILDIPFDEVLTVFEKKRDVFMEYQIAATSLFSEDCKNVDKTGFFDTTYLIERFCKFYLLLSGDKNRLCRYLVVIHRLHYNVKYADKITHLYQKIRNNHNNL